MVATEGNFWSRTTSIDLQTCPNSAGLYELSVGVARPCRAELHLSFEEPDRPLSLVALELIGELRLQTTFRIDRPCSRATLVISPPISPDEVTECALRPLSSFRRARLGARKFLKNIRNPRAFLDKLCHIVAGAGIVTIRQDRHRSFTRDDAYAFWQRIFESPAEGERLLSALACLGPEHSRRALFVYASAARAPDAVGDFLDIYEGREDLPYGADLLVIRNAASDMNEALVARVRRYGGRVVDHPGQDVPSGLVRRHAEQCGCACVVFLERRGQFHEFAVPAFLLAFGADPDCLAVYGDSDQLAGDGTRERPRFNPDWSPEYLLSFNHVGAPVAFRCGPRNLPSERTLRRAAVASFELLLALSQGADRKTIQHIPRVLFHERVPGHGIRERTEALETEVVREWPAARAAGACVQISMAPGGGATRRLCYPLNERPLVSVIIPTKDNPALLRDAADSVLGSDYPKLELLIADNGSQTQEQRHLLSELGQDARVRVLSLPMPFNYSRLNNIAAGESSGEILVLLNDDTRAVTKGWLGELASLAVQPDVGCVGALLLYADGTVQHAGVVLGTGGLADHAFRHADPQDASSDLRLHVRHEVSAVTGACMAVRKSVYQDAGGLREELAVDLNDVDFCLRLRERGYRNLYTPHARLLHLESVSRRRALSRQGFQRQSREQAAFVSQWGIRILNDPYYSPNLSRASAGYKLIYEE